MSLLVCLTLAAELDVQVPPLTVSPLQKLLSEVGMSEADLDHEVTDLKHLHKLSLSLDDWELYAVPLGLTTPEINTIKLDPTITPEVKRRAVLLKWKSKGTHLATYLILVDVFVKNDSLDLAREVCNIRKGMAILEFIDNLLCIPHTS